MCSAPTTVQSSTSLSGVISPSQMAEGGPRNRNGHHIADCSDDDLESSPKTHTLEKGKADRTPVSKSEEDRRRRTIIIEKKNGSYGFTIQSYGIHYKKEQEVEMITYVDFVEYDGPAYKAGMREGDVILSINGADMEKADHKTLVAFIKNCDTRMRMVVLFEDCVRKVELHMRYIQLQNILNAKMNELERTCLRERELLEGKWKTHSLPARKKATTSPSDGSENATTPTDSDAPYCRPTLSTEDVNSCRLNKQRSVPPPTQFMLTYQYLDPHCRYILRPSTGNSGEYLVSIGQPSRSKSEHQQLLGNSSSSEHIQHQIPGYRHPPQYGQQKISQNASLPPAHQNKSQTEQKTSKSRHCHGHSCNPCVGQKKDKTNGDNVSLDAYDLASPCCDPHCVPTRRKNRHHKDHHHKHKHRDKESKERTPRPRSQSHASPTAHPVHNNTNHNEKHTHRPRFYDISAGLASHCSLHSCTSSDMGAAEQSLTSYSTSLSTDTLFWDPNTETSANSRQQSTKSRQSYLPHQAVQMTPQQQQQYIHRYHIHAAQVQPTSYGCPAQYITNKPKSWDNLAMKGYGGYGFGYGYLDTVGPKKQIPSTAKLQQDDAINQQRHSIPRKNPYGRYSTLDIENYAPPPSQFVQAITTTTITKSTENLIGTPFNQSDSNLHSTCVGCKEIQHFHQHDCRGYYSHLPRTTATNVTTTNGSSVTNGRGVATVSEVTRL